MATPSHIEFHSVLRSGPLLKQVIKMASTQRKTLGFLPDAAFAERVDRGTLLAAADVTGQFLRGYVLYDLVGGGLKIRQLCIDPTFRRTGLARQLVEQLVLRHPGVHSLSLWCRRDFEANNIWPQLGFAPRTEKAGRASTPTTLFLWVRNLSDIHKDTLFSLLHREQKLRVALDTNVLYDLHDRKRGASDSRGLLAEWIQAEVQFCITEQVLQDIAQIDDEALRKTQRAWTSTYHEPHLDFERRRQLALLLENQCPSQSLSDRSDVNHVAACAASGLRILLTRDRAMIKRLRSQALAIAGVEVLSPSEFLGHQLETLQPARYAPVRLFGLEYDETPVRAAEVEQLVSMFAFPSHGGAQRALKRTLQDAIANPGQWHTGVVRRSETPVALVIGRLQANAWEVPIIRILDEHDTLGRQLLAQLKLTAIERSCKSVLVTDSVARRYLVEPLLAENFWPGSDGWLAVSHRVSGSGNAVADALEEIATTTRHRDALALLRLGPELDPIQQTWLESLFWPAKCLDGRLPSYTVPIKPTWTRDLLGAEEQQASLLARPPSLGLAREHVYYKSPRGPRPLAPSRILWYRSSRDPGVIASSRLMEVVEGPAETLHSRFQHLGVWELSHVLEKAHKGNILAMRFADTEIFERPVTLRRMRQLASDTRHSLVLRSPSRIPEHMFEHIYAEAFSDAR